MIKYNNFDVVFSEIPDKVSLAINITNCQYKCMGCHSPELREDIGIELTTDEIDNMLLKNSGVNCVVFMGEGNDSKALRNIALYTKNKHKIEVAIYSGSDFIRWEFEDVFDYIKIGHYDEVLGDLRMKTTNQKLFHFTDGKIIDITYKYWKDQQ